LPPPPATIEIKASISLADAPASETVLKARLSESEEPRKIAADIVRAATAVGESEERLVGWLTMRLGIEPEQASQALQDLRKM
jgi:hypothetical protein